MTKRKLLISLTEDLADKLDAVVGRSSRSEFIETLLRRSLEQPILVRKAAATASVASVPFGPPPVTPGSRLKTKR